MIWKRLHCHFNLAVYACVCLNYVLAHNSDASAWVVRGEFAAANWQHRQAVIMAACVVKWLLHALVSGVQFLAGEHSGKSSNF
ncbi:hypothetical protein [Alkalimonas mucilaginosa]|uniref:Secreted protein n=1 Tax=Alkalimonas mucilaginosa TaxID=3057676 RepID=A0ABU7JGT2_9GAMM|nr:hypothetical protein [Alkalimonas sp. MEB004]MEE2024847.1 hypothetical protein [Alkalimonas sp. MEB004]